MAGIIQSIAGMGDMTEQVIATDLLISAKAGVWNYAAAISETATPEVREVLRRHLDAEIQNHGKIFEYMAANGYYYADDPSRQVKLDLKTAQTALRLGEM